MMYALEKLVATLSDSHLQPFYYNQTEDKRCASDTFASLSDSGAGGVDRRCCQKKNKKKTPALQTLP